MAGLARITDPSGAVVAGSGSTSIPLFSIPMAAALELSPYRSDWHSYDVKTYVGKTSEFNVDDVYGLLRKYAAPGIFFGSGVVDSGAPVTLPFLGTVNIFSDPASRTVYNVTSSGNLGPFSDPQRPLDGGHLFYPGIVIRRVAVENDDIYIQTLGVGNGNYPELNSNPEVAS